MGFQKLLQHRTRGNHEVAIAAAFIGLSLIAITPQLNTNIGGFVSNAVGGSNRSGSKIQVQTLGSNPATFQFDNGDETGGDLSRPSLIPTDNSDNTEVGATLNTAIRPGVMTTTGSEKSIPDNGKLGKQGGIELGDLPNLTDEATGDILKPPPRTGGHFQTDIAETGDLLPTGSAEVGGTANRTAGP